MAPKRKARFGARLRPKAGAATAPINSLPAFKTFSGPRTVYTAAQLLAARFLESTSEPLVDLELPGVLGKGLGVRSSADDDFDADELRDSIAIIEPLLLSRPTDGASDAAAPSRAAAQSPGRPKAASSGGSNAPALETSSNAWRRGAQRDPIVVFRNKINFFLNQMTLEKFDRVSSSILQYCSQEMNQPAMVDVVAAEVFAKAIDQPLYASMYANLCVLLSNKLGEVAEAVTGVSDADFRRALLGTCQGAFLRGFQGVQREPEMTDAEFQLAVMIQKAHLVGNIAFVGQLYIKKLVPEKVIHLCIEHLLRDREAPQDEDMLQLCQLLDTVGERLEKDGKVPAQVAGYFALLKSLGANAASLSPRIKFMIMDLLDLRTRDWVRLAEKVEAKTIKQLRKEQEEEELRIELETNPEAVARRKAKTMAREYLTAENLSAAGAAHIMFAATRAAPGQEEVTSPLAQFQVKSTLKGSFDRYSKRVRRVRVRSESEEAALDEQRRAMEAKLQKQQPVTAAAAAAAVVDPAAVAPQDQRDAQRQKRLLALSQAPCKKADVDKLIKELFKTMDVKKAVSQFTKLSFTSKQAECSKSDFVSSLVLVAIDRDADARQKAASLLLTLLQTDLDLLDAASVEKALADSVFSQYADLLMDAPKLGDYVCEIIIMLVASSALSAAAVLRLVHELVYVDNKFAAEKLVGVFVKGLLRHLDVAQVQAAFDECGTPLLQHLAKPDNKARFQKSFDLPDELF